MMQKNEYLASTTNGLCFVEITSNRDPEIREGALEDDEVGIYDVYCEIKVGGLSQLRLSQMLSALHEIIMKKAHDEDAKAFTDNWFRYRVLDHNDLPPGGNS